MIIDKPAAGVGGRFREATDLLRHRGPDDEGFAWLPAGGQPQAFGGQDTMNETMLPPWEQMPPLTGAGILLGHRRLSILDVSAAGHQPMAAADGRVWITYNGEIYNFKELRAELADGFDFRTGTDTEVILAAWLKWGRGMLPRFEGMFAFGIVDLRDAARPLVLLARDPFGIKPLYHTRIGGAFAFASEIKALLALGAPAAPDAARTRTYFTEGCTDFGDGTMLAGIHQVPAGHWMEVAIGGGKTETTEGCYWNPDRQASQKIARPEAAMELRRLFLDNVRLHLRSDVPVGAALSGGIDSSSIVCGIRSLEPAAEIKTFSFIPSDETQSEEHWMDAIAQHAGTIPHKTQPSAQDMLEEIGAVMEAHDEPFATSSVFAQFRVFQLAREHGIKVMLDGQGADELLGGYHGFASLRLATMLRRGRWLHAARFIRGARHAVGGRGWPLLRGAVRRLFTRGGAGRARRQDATVLRQEWFAERGATSPCLPPRDRGGDRLREGLWYSLANGLPRLLRFEDRNSMAHSVESRVPFLTPRLAEFILSLPEEFIIDDEGGSKSIFREAMRGLTPDPILDRRDKIGFDTPEAAWLMTPAVRGWARTLLHSDTAAALPMLNTPLMRHAWDEAAAGRSPCPPWMWRVLCFLLWVEKRGVRCA